MGKWTEMRAADFIEFNPRMSIKKGTIATKVAMDKLQPFTKKIPDTEKAPFSGGSKFRNGDTIMARITPCLENGKTAFVDILGEDEIAFGSTEFIVMRAKEGVSDPQFIYYLATSPSFRNISSIILFDDVHAASAWRILESFTAIPVEHMMIERVKQNKSLVDVMLISRTCQEHYKNNVDSFILVSSDSDYWGLISSLQDARFLVMIERESCGPDLKNALSDAGIFYCYIDDFYSGNTEDIKQGALFKEMYRYIDNAVRLNIFEMFDEAIRTTRIEMSSAEKQQFISQYVKTMQMRITDSGDVVLEFNRK